VTGKKDVRERNIKRAGTEARPYYIASISDEETTLPTFTGDTGQRITHNDHLKDLFFISPPYLHVLSFLSWAIFLNSLYPLLCIVI
jgi:hypothetical protein